MKKRSKRMSHEGDLSVRKGVRGKYAKAFRAGHTVRIYDGTKLISDEYFAAIAPDVLAYFPDSKAINATLRKLVALVPQNGKSTEKPR